jgi:hypothetical protein
VWSWNARSYIKIAVGFFRVGSACIIVHAAARVYLVVGYFINSNSRDGISTLRMSEQAYRNVGPESV